MKKLILILILIITSNLVQGLNEENDSIDLKNINIIYSKKWIRGQDQVIEIESYNTKNNLFNPLKTEINYSILGVTLESSRFENNKSINAFEVSELTELGDKTIEIIITENITIKENINIKIIDENIENKKIKLLNDNKLMLLVLSVVLILCFFLILMITVMIDNNRKQKA